tara:strand:- start:2622 stop:2888 length:267 start_codon:yes stop_codon:yes gene_type:complete
LTGAGAFLIGMSTLKKYNLDNHIKDRALKRDSLIGIGLGLQILFEDRGEFQKSSGIDLIKGSIKIMKHNKIKLSHMGWNKIFSIKNNH